MHQEILCQAIVTGFKLEMQSRKKYLKKEKFA